MVEDGRVIEEINEYIDTRIFTSDMTFRGWWGTNDASNVSLLTSGSWISHLDSELLPSHAFDEGLAYGIGTFLLDNDYKNVADFGCGWTAYTVKYLRKMGLLCAGYDGDHLIEKKSDDCFVVNLAQEDLMLPVYDFVISLEVGEHIPVEYEGNFINNCDRCNRHGVIISWANTDDGWSHVNPKEIDEVVSIFKNMGYVYDNDVVNQMRKSIVCHWYRDRLMVFRR